MYFLPAQLLVRGDATSHILRKKLKMKVILLWNLLTWLFVNLTKHPPQLASRSVLKYYLIDSLGVV